MVRELKHYFLLRTLMPSGERKQLHFNFMQINFSSILSRPRLDCGYVQNNTLRSPRYPSHYPNNMDCVYRVPIPIDKDLWIFFSYFSLEDNKNCT